MKESGKRRSKKRDFSSIMAGVQVVFGITIFTSAWWVGDTNNSALYIFGFVTVLLGIATYLTLTGKGG
ncbi:MAG: hypothetical protein C4534_04045 [Gaiellales bacterium]|nr:MAG: hypothetical protein C4534_04045 [Gaiellales bacterium]